MNPDLQQIEKAATGLMYISESDYPFEVVQLNGQGNSIKEELKMLSGGGAAKPSEETTLEFFLRNHTNLQEGQNKDQKQTAERFIELQQVLQQKLKNIKVYKLGQIEIDVYIIGELSDGTFGGLKTRSIET